MRFCRFWKSSSDDQSGRQHMMNGGLWKQSQEKRGTAVLWTLLLDFVSFWETLLFLGAVRNNILCLALVLRQSIVLWLILLLNFLLIPPLTSVLILMLIGPGILLTAALLLDFVLRREAWL